MVLQDAALVHELKTANEKELVESKQKEEDAKATEGDVEVLEIQNKHALYVCKSGNKDEALALLEACLVKTVGGAARIDVAFAVMRLALAHGDTELLGKWVAKSHDLVEKEGDWERRNRLGVYKAVHAIVKRDFKTACKHLIDAVSTFTCTELMSFETLVMLTVLVAMVHAERVQLKEQVILSPDVLQCINDIPHLKPFLMSLYECRFAQFFKEMELISETVRCRFISLSMPFV